MSFPSSSASQDPSSNTTADPTPSGARSTRASQPAWQGANPRQAPRRGVTPISTASSAQTRSGSVSGSPSRVPFSPTTAGFNHSAITANRQVASRQSSTSSNNSFASPSAAGQLATGIITAGQRSRAPTSTGSPRQSSSLASLPTVSQGAAGIQSASGATSRFARHSPSLSGSTVGSPVSAVGGGSSSGQLTSLLVTQLNILLSTIKENNFESQAEKIRKLVDDNGMELFVTYFRRLLQNNAQTVFPSTTRATAPTENAASYQMLVQEVQKIVTDPLQADKIAQSLDTSEGELFRDLDLSAFIEHFRLDHISTIALVAACRTASKSDLRSKGESSDTIIH